MTNPITPLSSSGVFRSRLVGAGALVALALTGAAAAVAQQAERAGSDALLDSLRSCRSIADDAQRAACYDASAGALVTAVEAGDVRLVDREEVRRTRRQLFGLNLPETKLLKLDERDELEETQDLFETTIASGRQVGPTTWRFTTVEGAVWEINNPPRKIAPIAAGDKVVFKKASLGYYFIRINTQIGVKGRRVG